MLQNVDFFKTLLNGIKSKFQSQQKQISKHNTRLDDQQAQIEDLKNKKIDAVLYTPQTLTDEQQKQARDNIGADVGGYFEIRVTKSGDTYTADKTYNEIKVAVESGLTPVCRMKRWASDAILDDVFYYYNWQIVNNVPDANAFTFNNMSISVSRFIAIYNDGIVHYFDNMYNFYTLPTATSTTLGGVRPVAKTDVMTQDVGVDENGKLYTKPAEGGETWELINEVTLSEDAMAVVFDKDKSGAAFALRKFVVVGTTKGSNASNTSGGTICINTANNADDKYSIVPPSHKHGALKGDQLRHWHAAAEILAEKGWRWYLTGADNTWKTDQATIGTSLRSVSQTIPKVATYLALWSRTSGSAFAAGSKIELYGVRA